MTRLNGKVALVTGGSRGIGAAIVRRLAQEGASVAFTYLGAEQEAQRLVQDIRSQGGRALALRADAAKVSEARRVVSQVATEFGALDILVNNAGVLEFAEIATFGDEAFERVLGVNVRSVYYCTRAASEILREAGRIIHIGSINAGRMPFRGGSVYALSKAAVVGFARGLARDLGPRGITVNVIEPGPIATDMNPENGPMADTLRAQVALNRFGRPAEVAALVAFLASSEAAFITGASLPIDGGFAA